MVKEVLQVALVAVVALVVAWNVDALRNLVFNEQA